MRSNRRSGARFRASLLLAASLFLAMPNHSQASPETLKRSVSNMLQGPLDMILSPITTATNMTRKMRDVDDHWAVRAFFFLPGYVWYTGVVFGGGALRVGVPRFQTIMHRRRSVRFARCHISLLGRITI